MKTLAIPSFIFLLFVLNNCNSKIDTEQQEKITETDSKLVFNFLNDISCLESVEKKSQIIAFKEEATALADRMIPLNKDNIASVLVTAKHYKALVITVEDHTIVKVSDLADCKLSGSWGTCMPVGEGYIKKGGLVKQKDYINNIIGVCDEKERVAYLFN